MDEPSAREIILLDLWQRNALRRDAQLPLIDVKEELELALRQRAVNDYSAARAELEHLRPFLEAKYIARRRRRDPNYVPNMNTMGRWMVNARINKVLARILRMRTGRVHPGWAGRMIRYGEAADDADDEDGA